MRFGLLPVVLIVCGAGLSAMAQRLVPPENPIVAQIDFPSLHRQAVLAQEMLRQTRDRRIAETAALD